MKKYVISMVVGVVSYAVLAVIMFQYRGGYYLGGESLLLLMPAWVFIGRLVAVYVKELMRW